MSIIRKEQLSNPLSASYALTASFALNAGGSSIDTGSLVTTSSFNAYTASINNFTSSYNTGSFSGSFTGSLSGTASYALNSNPPFPYTGSARITGSLDVIGSVSVTGSLLISGSGLTVSSSRFQMPQYINITGSTRQLLSSDSIPSIDWGNRSLLYNDGNNIFHPDPSDGYLNRFKKFFNRRRNRNQMPPDDNVFYNDP